MYLPHGKNIYLCSHEKLNFPWGKNIKTDGVTFFQLLVSLSYSIHFYLLPIFYHTIITEGSPCLSYPYSLQSLFSIREEGDFRMKFLNIERKCGLQIGPDLKLYISVD